MFPSQERSETGEGDVFAFDELMTPEADAMQAHLREAIRRAQEEALRPSTPRD